MTKESIAQILAKNFSQVFVDAMKARMVHGYLKYGPLEVGFPSRVNALESMQQRLKKYEATGNTEWLVDAANYLMIEFMKPQHPNAHFRATESTESPGYVTNSFEVASGPTRLVSDEEWKMLLKHRESVKR